MNELTTYEQYQLERWGNYIPETPDNSSTGKSWFERQAEIIEQQNELYDYQS